MVFIKIIMNQTNFLKVKIMEWRSHAGCISSLCLNSQEEMVKYSSYEHEGQTIPKICSNFNLESQMLIAMMK